MIKKQTLVQVTQKDIDHGRQGDCENCAITLALKRAFNNNGMSVGFSFVFNEKYERIAETPNEVKLFIDNFDSVNPQPLPLPFSFILTHE